MSDPRIDKIRQDYGLSERDVWELPQKRGTYLIRHSAVEAIAAKAGIVFDMPTILEADSGNGLAALIVRGSIGERFEWSIGEASPKNIKVAYPWAMAEKRAKDRVVLKLVGLHGLVYSQDEMPEDDHQDDDRREWPQGGFAAGHDAAPSKSSAQLKREVDLSKEFEPELAECLSLPRLEKFRIEWKKIADKDGWNTSFRHMAQELMARQKDFIISQMSPEHLAVLPVKETLQASLRTSVQRPLDDDFPGDR